MTVRRLAILGSCIILAAAIAIRYISREAKSYCRLIPGDPTWPSKSHWDELNQTVGGNLIATTPIATPCHNSSSNALFDQEACEALRDAWFSPTTHLRHPSSPMTYQFTNNSCNPFTSPGSPCSLGYLPAYTINATTSAHLKAAVQVVKHHNIRLVTRNTGHDYLGKSTGAHALASFELIDRYDDHDNTYDGPAIKMGAGVEGLEASTFAHAHGLMVVASNGPNVDLAGGFTQGGGIGILSSRFGLAADQVLAREVVTAAGELVTTSPTSNADLFWALRGGGGGTYGIVVSMTVKAYPDTFISLAYLTVLADANASNTEDAIYAAVGTFLQSLPALVDAGVWLVWVAHPGGFLVTPAMASDLHPAELDALFQPTLDALDSLGLRYEYSSAEYPDFLAGYHASTTASWPVAKANIGGRLIPRELVQDADSLAALVTAIRLIGSQTVMSGAAFNVAGARDDVAVNPYFHKTLFSAVMSTPINYTDWAATKAAQDKLTYELLPAPAGTHTGR
ncbi:Uu.00g002070.m01.CDS01 [Anthostomella pinea]|uniref:Uu.00g002070.m01.CDS01 n=1 Tax=Anthostomella pinea TaxID=933095 RepID=A0AAI8YIQ1_9PEZI|nr:Uu.00g002070.m01.CDS01 [Anthostomella pinea]